MASLVDHLGGGVELPVHVRNRLDELATTEQGSLLAVQELGERPGGATRRKLLPLLIRERLDEVVAGKALSARVHDVPDSFLVDLEIPRDVRRGVPLLLLGLLVEIAQGLHVGFVIELPDGLEGC